MKKLLFTLLLAAATLPGWAVELYLVGKATPIGWKSSGRSITKMTETKTNIFVWSGLLEANTNNNDGFKICKGDNTWGAYTATDKGQDITSGTEYGIQESDVDYKWDITETGYYTVTIDLTRKKLTATKIHPASFGIHRGNDPYPIDYLEIGSANALSDFAYLVNNGTNSTSFNANLTADITLDGDHTPIGTSSNKYAGTFDGNKHIISNMSISSDQTGIGFFGYTNGATIKDLEILQANITITGTSAQNTGIVVGVCDNTTIQRCATVNSYLSGRDHTGSIAGSAKGGSTISNCYSNAKVQSLYQAGGMVGTMNGDLTLEKCLFMGPCVETTSSQTAAGLISRLEDGTLTLQSNFVAAQYVLTPGAADESNKANPNCKALLADKADHSYLVTFSGGTNNYSLKTTRYGKRSKTYNFSLSDPSDKNGGQKQPSEINQTFFSSTLGFDFDDTWKMVSDLTYAGGSFPILKWMTEPSSSVEISTAQELYDFSTFMWDNQNATLANNITYTDDSYQGQDAMIGNEVNPYTGTFDGDCKTITVAFNNTTANETGLFRYIKGGTVKNLKVAGTITTDKQFAGGICSRLEGTGTIKNCESNVAITDSRTSSGDGTHGGVLACVRDVTDEIMVENCLFSGSFVASNSHGCGGVVGWTADNSNVKVKNCLVTGSLGFENHSNNSVIARENDTHAVLTNCKFTSDLTDLASVKTNGLTRTTSGANTGALCYLLNSEISGGTDWYQNLSPNTPDDYPIPFSTHKLVYQNQETPSEVYSNYDITLLDGKYQISDAATLRNFSEKVNDGFTTLNAELTADIDMSSESYTPIGTSTNKYRGTFDGKNHFVKLNINTPSTSRVGFIAYAYATAEGGAYVKNLLIKGSVKGDNYVAGIIGSLSGTGGNITFENCGNEADITASGVNAGGIFGCSFNGEVKARMINCYNSGDISGNESGQLTGWSTNTEITNCYTTGERINGCHPFARLGGDTNTITNCYSDQDLTWDGHPDYVTASEIASGKLCYLLNGDQSDIVWYQNIEEENSHPVPFSTSKQVRQANTGSFTNLAVSDSKAQIGSADDLTQFSLEVNRGGNVNTNAVLTDNINMTSVGTDWWPIGSGSNKYAGTFDGAEHDITFEVDYGESSEYAKQALFGEVTNGASISNLIVKGKFRANSQVAGVVAYADGDGPVTLNNIMNYADVEATGNDMNANASGLVACAVNDINLSVTNCANLGIIRSGNNQSAAFAGWVDKSATFTNCWNIGEIYNNGGSDQLYRHSDVVNPVNCYDLTEFGSQGDKSLDADAAVTGELCFKVNNGGSNWYQTLGTDNYPVPFSSSESVLAGQWFNSSENDVYYNKDASDNITVYQLNLNDTKEEYKVPAKVTAKNVKMTRTLHALTADGTTARWNTFCSPVAIDKSNFSAAKELTDVTANGNNYSMAFTNVEGGVLEAGKPYMVQVSESKSSLTASNVAVAAAGTSTSSETFNGLTFTGNFTNGNAPLGSFIISNNVFYLVDTDTNTDGISEVALKAFRGYITTASNVKALTFDFDDDATSLSSISSPEGKECIYNLAGQRINKMQKGINIVNGKKILF